MHTHAFKIVTTRAKAQANRDALIRLLRGAICAERYIAANRTGAQAELERWLKLEPGDLDDFFATTQFRVELDVPQIRSWMRAELEWLRERNPQTAVPDDLGRYVDPSFLMAVEPDRVISGVRSTQ